MLEITIYLLCVYLVFKGVEIYQMHVTSGNDDSSSSGRVAYTALIASVVLALLFVFWTVYHLKQVEQQSEQRRKDIEAIFNK